MSRWLFLDGDGDRISISSDSELIETMDRFDGTVFRLLVRGNTHLLVAIHVNNIHRAVICAFF